MENNEKFKFIELRLVDIYGKIRGMTIPLEPPMSLGEIRQSSKIQKGTNVDGSSLPEFADTENSDLHLDPDMNSLIPVPYATQPKAAVMCSLYNRGQGSDAQSPFLGDSRLLLILTMEKLFPEYSVRIKPEPEFYLYDSDGSIKPADDGGYIDIQPKSLHDDLLLKISDTLHQSGMNVHYLHHEVGPGQYEIEIEFSDAIKNCDNLVIFKPTVKTMAQQNGLQATFMPKPFSDKAGSGLHVHIQLWEEGENVFGDQDKLGEVSDIAKHFIAGILSHASAISAIANPSVNSYKRMVPGYEAPTYITWGYRNRSTMVRVPLFRDANKAAIEIRSPDFTCNPYMLLTALLYAGHDGIANKLTPPEPRPENIYHLTDGQLDNFGITQLPKSLEEALDAMEEDKLILDALGPHLGPNWITMKRREVLQYNSQVVTDYELRKYLDC